MGMGFEHWEVGFGKKVGWEMGLVPPLQDSLSRRNRTFPSYFVPLFQNEPSCKTFLMKMNLISTKMNL